MYRSPTSFRCGISHQHSTVVPGGGLAKLVRAVRTSISARHEIDWRVVGRQHRLRACWFLGECGAFATSVKSGSATYSSTRDVLTTTATPLCSTRTRSCSLCAASTFCFFAFKPYSSTVCAAGTSCARTATSDYVTGSRRTGLDCSAHSCNFCLCGANLNSRQTDSSSSAPFWLRRGFQCRIQTQSQQEELRSASRHQQW